NIYYWSAERSDAEIDFLVQYKNKIIPVEVKAEENLQAKSLRYFVQKNNSPAAVRTSMSDFKKEAWLTNLPLYAVSELTAFV
ncbi:MAG: DUF4143 domain-containing protein, partial [Spirochaetia bacterium]|nr:DUF4143 domain-containing protein [Spirochaetia bacterium]